MQTIFCTPSGTRTLDPLIKSQLKMGPYPQYLKERIAGPNGHMSNRETADFLAENINESLKYIRLCHLSKDNNHPELAYKTVELSLRNKGVIVGKDVHSFLICGCKGRCFLLNIQHFAPFFYLFIEIYSNS